jgi:hypothetical protein
LWAVAINLIALVVVLTIFSRGFEPFERVVLGALGVIYATIRTIAWGTAHVLKQSALGLAEEFFRVRRLLNDDSVDEAERATREALMATKSNEVVGWINLAFLAAIYVVCVFNILIS